MTRLRRLAVPATFVTAVLALLPAPVQAAPGDVEGRVFLRNLTLPADGQAVEESFSPLLFADEAGWADNVTLVIDTATVSVADVKIRDAESEGMCSAGPVVRCDLPGPHRVYERPDDDGTFGFVTFSAVTLSLAPKPGVPVGATGTLSITTKVDGGPATTETATIRIGEGVNLTAVDDEPRTVAPGGAVQLRPRVRNTGPRPIGGLTAVISADPGVLAGTDFGNCTYGYSLVCTFDTTLTAGATYRVSAPFTVRVPRDSAAASQASVGVQWLTAAEWQDWLGGTGALPEDRRGTGPDLELEQVAAPAAGAPQADIDNDDNGTYSTVTVSGRRTDLAAVGATVRGTAGLHRISVGLINRGPGTLHYPPFTNNLGFVSVSLPGSMSVVTADDRCSSPFAHDYRPPSSAPDDTGYFGPPEFTCALRPTGLRPGERLMFTFTVRTAAVAHDDAGFVQFDLLSDGADVDRDARNDQAPITVTGIRSAAGLPVTGSIAAAITGGAVILMLAGMAIVAATRRRPGPR